MNAATGTARELTSAFYGGEFDFSLRRHAPPASWNAMPEVAAANALRAAGADDTDVRLFLTFTSGMDRARDADRLWRASLTMFESPRHRWVFRPSSVATAPLLDLADTLRSYGVSQRHLPDAAAWRVTAETLASPESAPHAYLAIYRGVGDALDLLRELAIVSGAGSHRFPFLRGPKIGPMWVRMLAQPGRAVVNNIEAIPVAVDVHVRRVTEHLGIARTATLDLKAARPVIQAAWSEDVGRGGAEGPPGLENTCAALDPALWFMGKWGCVFCERRGASFPIAEICRACDLASVS